MIETLLSSLQLTINDTKCSRLLCDFTLFTKCSEVAVKARQAEGHFCEKTGMCECARA